MRSTSIISSTASDFDFMITLLGATFPDGLNQKECKRLWIRDIWMRDGGKSSSDNARRIGIQCALLPLKITSQQGWRLDRSPLTRLRFSTIIVERLGDWEHSCSWEEVAKVPYPPLHQSVVDSVMDLNSIKKVLNDSRRTSQERSAPFITESRVHSIIIAD